MKTVIFLTLLILLSSQLVLSSPDSTSSRIHNRKAWFAKIYRGQKGVERVELNQKYWDFMKKLEYQNAADWHSAPQAR